MSFIFVGFTGKAPAVFVFPLVAILNGCIQIYNNQYNLLVLSGEIRLFRLGRCSSDIKLSLQPPRLSVERYFTF